MNYTRTLRALVAVGAALALVGPATGVAAATSGDDQADPAAAAGS